MMLRNDIRAWCVVLGGIIAATMTVIDIYIANTAIGVIQRAFHVPLAMGAWISSAYLVIEVVALPMSALVLARLGERSFALWTSAAFITASLLCGAAPNFTLLCIFRGIQGFAGGLIMPFSYILIMRKLPREKHFQAMTAFSAAVAMAPTLAPIAAGILCDTVGWRWLFFVNLPVCLLAISLYIVGFIGEAGSRESRSIHWRGVVLVMIGLSSLQVALAHGDTAVVGSGARLAFAAIAVFALAAFVMAELGSRHPLIELKLLAERAFGFACVANAAAGAILFACFFLVPFYLVQVRGFGPIEVGAVFLAAGLGTLALVGVMPRLTKRYTPQTLSAAGSLVFAASMACWSVSAIKYVAPVVILAQLFRGVAAPLMLSSLGAMAMSSVVPTRAPSASILFNMSRSVGGALGVAGFSAMVSTLQAHFRVAAPGMQGQGMAFAIVFGAMAAALGAMGFGFLASFARRAAGRTA